MSNNFLNLHIEEGCPLGEDAEFLDIVEYYVDQYIKQQSQLRLLAEGVREAHSYVYSSKHAGYIPQTCDCPACVLAREIMEAQNENRE